MAINPTFKHAPPRQQLAVWDGVTKRSPTKGLDLRRLFRRPVKPSEMMYFSSQLALMLEVGTPLNTALNSIQGEVVNPDFRRVLKAVVKDIEAGRSFSQAMGRHDLFFDPMFVNMAKAGETGGFLQKTLERLVNMMEKRQALLQQLRSAFTYPVVLTLLGVGVVTFIMMGVLPKFEAVFAGKEHILPWSTRFLLGTGESLRQNWHLYAAGIAGLFVCLRFWSGTRSGQTTIDRILISAPFVRDLTNRIYTGEMLRTLGHLLESGIPLAEALAITRPTVRSRNYRRFMNAIGESISQGKRFAHEFGQNRHIPGTVKQMVTIGEEVGQLPKVMHRLARHYETEVETALKKFVSVIEPLALIFLGGIVGLIVSSIVLPLFRLSHALH